MDNIYAQIILLSTHLTIKDFRRLQTPAQAIDSDELIKR